MIYALHGAVGMAEDWVDFDVTGIDLWQLLEDGEISLEEAGEKIAATAKDGDTLIGYSMGGRLALHTLAHRQWEKVILVSTHPGLSEGYSDRLSNDKVWAEKALENWESFLTNWNAQAVLPSVSWGDRHHLKSRQQEISRSFNCWSLGRQKHFTDFPENLTWIVGEQDEKFRALAPEGAQIMANAGHRAPWEQPEAFRELLSEL